MALSNVPLAFARGIIGGAGVSVVAVNSGGVVAFPVPDNCHTILVTNPDVAKVGLVGVATAPAALTAGINAQRVPPGTTLTLSVGPIQIRGPLNEAALAGSGLVYDFIGAGGLTLEITYVCSLNTP